MVHASDYAISALDKDGFVEFTYDTQGQTVYCGHVVSVPFVVQKAQQKGIVIASQRTVIDNGSYTFVVARVKKT